MLYELREPPVKNVYRFRIPRVALLIALVSIRFDTHTSTHVQTGVSSNARMAVVTLRLDAAAGAGQLHVLEWAMLATATPTTPPPPPPSPPPQQADRDTIATTPTNYRRAQSTASSAQAAGITSPPHSKSLQQHTRSSATTLAGIAPACGSSLPLENRGEANGGCCYNDAGCHTDGKGNNATCGRGSDNEHTQGSNIVGSGAVGGSGSNSSSSSISSISLGQSSLAGAEGNISAMMTTVMGSGGEQLQVNKTPHAAAAAAQHAPAHGGYLQFAMGAKTISAAGAATGVTGGGIPPAGGNVAEDAKTADGGIFTPIDALDRVRGSGDSGGGSRGSVVAEEAEAAEVKAGSVCACSGSSRWLTTMSAFRSGLEQRYLRTDDNGWRRVWDGYRGHMDSVRGGGDGEGRADGVGGESRGCGRGDVRIRVGGARHRFRVWFSKDALDKAAANGHLEVMVKFVSPLAVLNLLLTWLVNRFQCLTWSSFGGLVYIYYVK